MKDKEIAQVAINTIRTLSIDAIQQANSGHPGSNGNGTLRVLFMATLSPV
jgi:transketolase